MDDNLDANLRWWITVTEIIEREPPDVVDIMRWRAAGIDLDECRKRLNERGNTKKWSREMIRQIEARVRRRIRESMTPPIPEDNG